MGHPFEVSEDELVSNIDEYVEDVFRSVSADFLIMPKGRGFVEYATFEKGYEKLRIATGGFRVIEASRIVSAVDECAISFSVLRCILGVSPPEWQDLAAPRLGAIPAGCISALDRRMRLCGAEAKKLSKCDRERIVALVESACEALTEGVPTVGEALLHRFDKADTGLGQEGLATVARMGVPYPVLLYERFLGRPFATHRDSVSELVGGILESAIEKTLDAAGAVFRKTGGAERLPNGLDPAPDFVVPNEYNPKVVIEAKLAQDAGTARDKVDRIDKIARNRPDLEVVACIAGRGFAVRKERMRTLLKATKGKVFTLQTMGMLVDSTLLRELRTR